MSAHETHATADPAATAGAAAYPRRAGAVLAFAAAARLVPETRDRSAGRPDMTGAVLLGRGWRSVSDGSPDLEAP